MCITVIYITIHKIHNHIYLYKVTGKNRYKTQPHLPRNGIKTIHIIHDHVLYIR